MSEFVPDAVRQEALRIAGDMGGPEPVVEPVRFRTWRFTWDDGRVHVYLDIRWHGRDRAEWAGSKLFIDGVEYPRIDGADRFRMLWAGASYEEAASLTRQSPPYAPSPIDDELPADQAPLPIRQQLQVLEDAFSGRGDVRYGRTGDVHTLAVDFHSEQRAMRLRLRGDGPIVRYLSIELWIDGWDVSAWVGNDLSRALAMLGGGGKGPAAGAPSGGPQVSGVSAGKGYASPDVRRSTVIRT